MYVHYLTNNSSFQSTNIANDHDINIYIPKFRNIVCTVSWIHLIKCWCIKEETIAFNEQIFEMVYTSAYILNSSTFLISTCCRILDYFDGQKYKVKTIYFFFNWMSVVVAPLRQSLPYNNCTLLKRTHKPLTIAYHKSYVWTFHCDVIDWLLIYAFLF